MKKKLLAGLLTVCMLVSLVPGMVYAEPAGEGNVQEEVPIEAVEEGNAQEEVPIEAVVEGNAQEEVPTEAVEEGIITADEAGEYHQVALEIPLIDSDTEIDVPAYYSSIVLTEYDNRSIMPNVRDQDPWGTCWTFASMAAAEGSLIAGKKQVDGSTVDANIDLSEYQLAYFQYHSVADPLGNTTGDATIGQNIWSEEGGDLVDTEGWYNYLNLGGNMIFATWTMAAWQAGADETTAPYYSISETGLDSSVASQNKVHLENAYWIPMTQKEYVKQMIMEYGAVGTSYQHGNIAFNYETNAYYSGTLSTEEEIKDLFGGHAVSIVGWDDNYSKENFREGCQPSENGAWLVRNSWGSYWGDDGYFWMSYEEPTLENDNKAMVFEFADADNYDYNYQYDGSCGVWRYTGMQGYSAANVFEVKGTGTQLLQAVGVGLYGSNMEYSIQIYMDPEEGNPTSGMPMLATSQTGKATFTGYHTIELEQPVELQQGHTFAVVFTFENDGGIFVDHTYMNGNWIRFVSATEKNQSFFITPSGEVEDLHEQGQCVRLKAFTSVESNDTYIENVKAQPGKDGSYTYCKDGKIVSQKVISAPSTIELSYTEGVYTGTGEYPQVTAVYDKAGKKIAARNYTVTYSDSNPAEPGTHTVTVTFGGAYYTGNLTSSYKLVINPVSGIKNGGSTNSSIDLSWDKNSNADGYELYRATSKTGSYSKIVTLEGNASCSYTNTGLSSGTSYYYKVRAYNKIAGKVYYSEYSDILCSTTNPSKVSSLKAASRSTSAIKLSWKAVSGAAGYQIDYYDSSAKSWKKLATVSSSATSYTNKSRKAGTTYKYRVCAYCKNESDTVYGSYSDSLSVSTKPAQVQSLKAGSNGTTSIKITWKKVTGASGYQVYRYDSSAKKWKKLATVGSSKNYYTNKELKSGTTYKYKVRAYRKDGDTTLYGSYSTVLTTAAKPAKVKSVKASSVKKTSLKLSWKKVTGASGYQIYQYKASKKKYVKIATVTKGSTVAKKLTSLKAKTTYKYKVRAYKKVNGKTIYGNYSDVIKVTTKK